MSNTKEIEISAVMALFKVLTANVQDKMISELCVHLGDISVDKLEGESEDDFRMRSFSVLFAMFSTTVLQGGNAVHGAPQSGVFPVGVQRNEINFLLGTPIGNLQGVKYHGCSAAGVFPVGVLCNGINFLLGTRIGNLQGVNYHGCSASGVFPVGVLCNEMNFLSGTRIGYESECTVKVPANAQGANCQGGNAQSDNAQGENSQGASKEFVRDFEPQFD